MFVINKNRENLCYSFHIFKKEIILTSVLQLFSSKQKI
jgi:hypothetical protein